MAAILTFDPKWCPRVNASAEVTYRIRKTQFGDGFTQVAGDGINSKRQEWALEFVGTESYIRQIKDFLDNKAGISSFFWTPPLGTKTLWRCESYKPTQIDRNNFSLSCTFVQSFAP